MEYSKGRAKESSDTTEDRERQEEQPKESSVDRVFSLKFFLTTCKIESHLHPRFFLLLNPDALRKNYDHIITSI